MSFFGFARELTTRRLKIGDHDEQKNFDQQVSNSDVAQKQCIFDNFFFYRLPTGFLLYIPR